jgi:hypothetical protein
MVDGDRNAGLSPPVPRSGAAVLHACAVADQGQDSRSKAGVRCDDGTYGRRELTGRLGAALVCRASGPGVQCQLRWSRGAVESGVRIEAV